MMPNINPKQMQQMMQKMGIRQDDIDAEEVIIKCSDHKIVIKNPSVARVNMQGNVSYQISGKETKEALDASDTSNISEDDIKTVMEQAKASRQDAMKALEDSNGDIAEAILSLTGEE